MKVDLTEKQMNTILDALEYSIHYATPGTVFKQNCSRLLKQLVEREQRARAKMILTSTYGKATQSTDQHTNDSTTAP